MPKFVVLIILAINGQAFASDLSEISCNGSITKYEIKDGTQVTSEEPVFLTEKNSKFSAHGLVISVSPSDYSEIEVQTPFGKMYVGGGYVSEEDGSITFTFTPNKNSAGLYEGVELEMKCQSEYQWKDE
jgi:hypothetical protein